MRLGLLVWALLFSSSATARPATLGFSPTCPDCRVVVVSASNIHLVGTPTAGVGFDGSTPPKCSLGSRTATGAWVGTQIKVPLSLTLYAWWKSGTQPLKLQLKSSSGGDVNIFIPR